MKKILPYILIATPGLGIIILIITLPLYSILHTISYSLIESGSSQNTTVLMSLLSLLLNLFGLFGLVLIVGGMLITVPIGFYLLIKNGKRSKNSSTPQA